MDDLAKKTAREMKLTAHFPCIDGNGHSIRGLLFLFFFGAEM
jgi:hypothetical protein